MGFRKLIVFLLSMINQSAQNALERFFITIGEGELVMTQQSFSEARQHLKWGALRELFDLSVAVTYEAWYEKWHGYRLLAVDGTKVDLPADKGLREYFGGVGTGGKPPCAQGSMLYDVLNRVVVDARLEPLSVGEGELAERHIEALRGLASFGKELLLFDRGYPSYRLMRKLSEAGVCFVMRVKRGFSPELDGAPAGKSRMSIGERKGEAIAVQVCKFELESGEIETLVTNLPGRLNVKEMKELYGKRWGVETEYDEVKNKLALENFSGRTERTIRQDFYAAMFLSNMAALLYREAQEEAEAAREGKGNKYEYRVNVNHEIGVLKDRVVALLLEEDEGMKQRMLDYVIARLSRRVVPVRPGRSVPRKQFSREVKFHHNQKINC